MRLGYLTASKSQKLYTCNACAEPIPIRSEYVTLRGFGKTGARFYNQLHTTCLEDWITIRNEMRIQREGYKAPGRPPGNTRFSQEELSTPEVAEYLYRKRRIQTEVSRNRVNLAKAYLEDPQSVPKVKAWLVAYMREYSRIEKEHGYSEPRFMFGKRLTQILQEHDTALVGAVIPVAGNLTLVAKAIEDSLPEGVKVPLPQFRVNGVTFNHI